MRSVNSGLVDGGWLKHLIAQQRAWLTDVVENVGHLQLRHAKSIAGVVGTDISASSGCRTHSPAGDSVSSEKPGDAGPAVLAAAASLAL